MQREQPEDEDAVWRDIVDNYGDRITLEPEVPDPAPNDDDAAPQDRAHPEPLGPELLGEGDESEDLDDPDGFVPEPAPRVPIAPPDRFLAWLGVFGSPAVFLVLVIFGISAPSLLNWILIGGFIGGFGYLVFRLPRTPEDPWDDGARI